MKSLASVSTDDIGGAGLSDGWKRLLSTYVARAPRDAEDVDITFMPLGAGVFKGVIEYGDIGTSSLCRIANSPQRYVRNASADAAPGAAAMIVVQTRGTSYFEQDGQGTCLSPGDWSVYDTGRAFSLTNADEAEHLILMQRSDCAGQLLGALRQVPNRRFGRAGTQRVVRDLITSAFRECAQMHYKAAEATASAIEQLVRTAIEEAGASPHAPAGSDQREQIIAFIHAHLADERLGVGMIATAFGYSTRQIHRMFHGDAGITVAEYIWKRRLERSFDDLRSASEAEWTITEIAFRWGFCSSAHFSRVFKDTFGVSPRECRNQGSTAPRRMRAAPRVAAG